MQKIGGEKTVLLIVSLLLLCMGLCAGCTVTGEKKIEQMPREISDMEAKRRQHMEQDSPVQTHDLSFLGKHRMKLVQERNLPEVFSQRVVVVEEPMTLPRAASKISQLAGVQIELSPRLQSLAEQERSLSEDQRADGNEALTRMPLQFEGKLKHLLDNVVGYHGAFWKFEDGRVYVFQLETKTYDLITSPGRTSVSNKINNENETNSGDSGKDSGDSSVSGYQKAEHEFEFDLWEKIVGNIKTMISDKGRVVSTQSAGTISVTDTPSIHAGVQNYMDQVNDRLSRQVAISVRVYAFALSDTDRFGYSLKAAFEDMEGQFGGTVEGIRTADITNPAGLLSAAILEKDKSAEHYDPAVQQWEGSEAIVRALDKQGNVRLVTSGSGIVMNNQPLPIQNTSRIGYLKKSEISQGETTTTAALESGTVTTGFSLNATPHILENNEVVLQYNITLSKLDDIKVIESGGSKIQTPEVSSRNFMQQARLNMGETLFLAGFQKQSDEYDNTSSAKGFLGWQKNGASSKEMVLVSITINEVDA